MTLVAGRRFPLIAGGLFIRIAILEATGVPYLRQPLRLHDVAFGVRLRQDAREINSWYFNCDIASLSAASRCAMVAAGNE